MMPIRGIRTSGHCRQRKRGGSLRQAGPMHNQPQQHECRCQPDSDNRDSLHDVVYLGMDAPVEATRLRCMGITTLLPDTHAGATTRLNKGRRPPKPARRICRALPRCRGFGEFLPAVCFSLQQLLRSSRSCKRRDKAPSALGARAETAPRGEGRQGPLFMIIAAVRAFSD